LMCTRQQRKTGKRVVGASALAAIPSASEPLIVAPIWAAELAAAAASVCRQARWIALPNAVRPQSITRRCVRAIVERMCAVVEIVPYRVERPEGVIRFSLTTDRRITPLSSALHLIAKRLVTTNHFAA